MAEYFLHPQVQKFIDDLPADTGSRVDRGLSLLKEHGRLLPPPDSKKVGKELFELRIRSTIQIRLFYGFSGDLALIVHGFIKKSDKIPLRELRLAHRRFSELA